MDGKCKPLHSHWAERRSTDQPGPQRVRVYAILSVQTRNRSSGERVATVSAVLTVGSSFGEDLPVNCSGPKDSPKSGARSHKNSDEWQVARKTVRGPESGVIKTVTRGKWLVARNRQWLSLPTAFHSLPSTDGLRQFAPNTILHRVFADSSSSMLRLSGNMRW
jgi:hypothetical protein